MIFRSEFSYRQAFGTVEQCLQRLPAGGIIADDGTWGHVPFRKAALKAKVPSGLGWRVRVSPEETGRENWAEVIIVPTSAAGLRDMYGLVRIAYKQFQWWPRLKPAQIGAGDWCLLAAPRRSGRGAEGLPPVGVPFVPGTALGGTAGAYSDNLFPSPPDREAWAFALGALARPGTAPAHIMDALELRVEGAAPEAIAATLALLERSASVELPKAANIQWPGGRAMSELREVAEAELRRRGLNSEQYRARLGMELNLVAEKGFADYFLAIADVVRWAKARMLVGPGRGSSAGSLICWLLRIVEVDPIAHGLLFERFIDVNRFDTPDIDIDFPDEGRPLVLHYLAEKYGQENVAHIGTVMRFKAKSALIDVAKQLNIPAWELDAFKDTIVERSSGDSRVNDCLKDTLAASPKGQLLLAQWPQLAVACLLEGGARQSGMHAAGMIVCNEPVANFCGIGQEEVAQIDKKSAEALNMLKIDALGLRTLSVLDTACKVAGIDREMLYTLPLNDPAVFEIFNQRRLSNLFQFEGNATQSLSSQIKFRDFTDIVALTALARPGPLGGGEATRWVARHEGDEAITFAHPKLEAVTKETLGSIIYQEQVMVMCREVGGFSWADTAAIRKLMSNRTGEEAFRNFEKQFITGAVERGMTQLDAEKLWKAINSFGSWAMNKSHCVVYGMITYWCAWFKAHQPLAFAAGCLRHAKDDDSAMATLRELVGEGIEYTALDPARSGVDWEVVDGRLLGGLVGVPGIGAKTAADIIARRTDGRPLKPGQIRLLSKESKFSNPFPIRSRFAHIYSDPKKHNIFTRLSEIASAKESGEYCILGVILKKSLRDMNDDHYLNRRNGRRLDGPIKMLILHLADDSGRIIAIVNRYKYLECGKRIVEEGVEGKTYLLLKGSINEARFFDVHKVRWLS